MSTTTTEKATPEPTVRPAGALTSLAEHAKRKAKIAARVRKNRPLMRKCLDAEFAARLESRKSTWEFTVTAEIQQPNKKGKLEFKTYEETVRARSEADAWAHFCDKIETYPSPHACQRTIVKRAKVG